MKIFPLGTGYALLVYRSWQLISLRALYLSVRIIKLPSAPCVCAISVILLHGNMNFLLRSGNDRLFRSL